MCVCVWGGGGGGGLCVLRFVRESGLLGFVGGRSGDYTEHV